MTSYCETALFQLSLHLDGALEESLLKKLEGHLASCSACSQAREDLEKNEILLKEALEPLFDTSFTESVLQRMNQRSLFSKEGFTASRERMWPRNPNFFSHLVLQLTAACLLFGLVGIFYAFYTEDLPISSSQTHKTSENISRFATIPSQEKLLKDGKYLCYEEIGELQFPLYVSAEYPQTMMTLFGDGSPQIVLFHKESGKMKLYLSCNKTEISLASDLILEADKAQFQLFFHHPSIQASSEDEVGWIDMPFFLHAESSLQFSIHLVQGSITLQTPRKKFKVKPGLTDRFTLPSETLKGIEVFSDKPKISTDLATLWNPVQSFFQNIQNASVKTPPLETRTQELQIDPPTDFQASVHKEKLLRCYRYSIKLSWLPIALPKKTLGYYLYRETETGEKILLNPEKKPLLTPAFEDKYKISSIVPNTYRYSIQAVLREEGKEILSESAYTDITINPMVQFSYTGGDDEVATFKIYLMNQGVREIQTCSTAIGHFVTGKPKGDLEFSTGFELKRIYQEKQSTFILRNGKKVPLPATFVRKVELYNPETKETIQLSK